MTTLDIIQIIFLTIVFAGGLGGFLYAALKDD